MTTEEFSNEFDVLINNYANSPEYGKDYSSINLSFDEYEKSVFLTKAQEEILLSYYNGTNSKREGYDASEEVRRYLSSLNNQTTIEPTEQIADEEAYLGNLIINPNEGYDYVISIPENIWFITLETIRPITNNECTNNKLIEVTPITQDEFHRIINNPFRGINERRALRIETDNNKIELLCKYKNYYYTIYYLSKPSPIILTDLGDLSINKKSTRTDCTVHETLHRTILQRAVQLAIASKIGSKTQQ